MSKTWTMTLELTVPDGTTYDQMVEVADWYHDELCRDEAVPYVESVDNLEPAHAAL